MTRAFRVGERVDGLYDANTDDVWYPARVRSVSTSTVDGQPRYELLYDDGEVEMDVPPACVRVHAEGNLSVGTRVVARYAGGEELYAGRVAEVQDNERYTVEYDDGEVETDVVLEYISEPPEQEEAGSGGDELPGHQSPSDAGQAGDEGDLAVDGSRQEATRQVTAHPQVPVVDDGIQSTPAAQPIAIQQAESSPPPAKKTACEASAPSPHSSSSNPSAAASIESLELLRSRLSDASSAKSALSSLVKQMRAFPQDTATLVHSHNGETLLLDVLTTHRAHAVVQCYAFVLLRRLCFLSTSSTCELLASDRGDGVVARILSSMRSFADDAILQAAACGALAVFTREEAGLASLLDQRAALAVLGSLRTHRTYSVHTRQVHYYGSEVLLELCELGDRDTMTALCAAEMPINRSDDASPIELLLFLLRQALSFDDKKACCAVGSLLMCLAASDRSAAARVLRLNGLPELSTVMAKFAPEPGIQKFAASASKAIALSSIQSIQSTSTHAHKQPAPSKKVRERAAEILMESESMESLKQETHRSNASRSSLIASRRTGKPVNGASSTSAGSIRKRKANAPAPGASPRSAAASDPRSFSKFASPIGRAPQYNAFNGSHFNVSTSREQLQQGEQAQARVNSSLVILDAREDKQSQLFDTYGIPAASRHRNSLGGVKRTQLKTHVVANESSWATRVSGQQLMRDDLLTGPVDTHRPIETTDSSQTAFNHAYANYNAAMGHSTVIESGHSPVKFKKKTSSPGTTTALKVRIETEAHALRAKALRSPFASPLAPSKRDHNKPKRSKHAASTPRSSRVHSGLFSSSGADSMNAYATQLFTNNGPATPHSNSKSSARSGADRHERERLSFADKLHKMIDKAKSTLATSNVTSMPIEPSPTFTSPKSTSRSDRPAAPSTKTRGQAPRQPLAASGPPVETATEPVSVSKKKMEAFGSASSTRKPKAMASSSSKPVTPASTKAAASPKHKAAVQPTSLSTRGGKGEAAARPPKPTTPAIAVQLESETTDRAEDVEELTDLVERAPREDSEPVDCDEVTAQVEVSDAVEMEEAAALVPEVVEPADPVVDASVSEEEGSAEKGEAQEGGPTAEVEAVPVESPDQVLTEVLAPEEDAREVANDATASLSAPEAELQVVHAVSTTKEASATVDQEQDVEVQSSSTPAPDAELAPNSKLAEGSPADTEPSEPAASTEVPAETPSALEGEGKEAIPILSELLDQPAPTDTTTTEEQEPSASTDILRGGTVDQETVETPDVPSSSRAATPMDDMYADAENEFDDGADDVEVPEPEPTEVGPSDSEHPTVTTTTNMTEEDSPLASEAGDTEVNNESALPSSRSGDQLYGDDEYDEFEDEDAEPEGDAAEPGGADLNPEGEASSPALVTPNLDDNIPSLAEREEEASVADAVAVEASGMTTEATEPASTNEEVAALDGSDVPDDAGAEEEADTAPVVSIAAEEDPPSADQVEVVATEDLASGGLESPPATEEDTHALEATVDSGTSASPETVSSNVEEQGESPGIAVEDTAAATETDPSVDQGETVIDADLTVSRPATAAYGDDDFDDEDAGDSAEPVAMEHVQDTGGQEDFGHEVGAVTDVGRLTHNEGTERIQPLDASLEEPNAVVVEPDRPDPEPESFDDDSVATVESSVDPEPAAGVPVASEPVALARDEVSSEDVSSLEQVMTQARTEHDTIADVEDAYGDGEFDDDGTRTEIADAEPVDATSEGPCGGVDPQDATMPEVGDAVDVAATTTEIETEAMVGDTLEAVAVGDPVDDPVDNDDLSSLVDAVRPEDEDQSSEAAATDTSESHGDREPAETAGEQSEETEPSSTDHEEVTVVSEPSETALDAGGGDDPTPVDEPVQAVEGSTEEAGATQSDVTGSVDAVDDNDQPAAIDTVAEVSLPDPKPAEGGNAVSDNAETVDTLETPILEPNHQSTDDTEPPLSATEADPPLERGEPAIVDLEGDSSAKSTAIEPEIAVEAEIDVTHSVDTEPVDACIESQERADLAVVEAVKRQQLPTEEGVPEPTDGDAVDFLDVPPREEPDDVNTVQTTVTECSDVAYTADAAQGNALVDTTSREASDYEFEDPDAVSDEANAPVLADEGGSGDQQPAEVETADGQAAPGATDTVVDAEDGHAGDELVVVPSDDSSQSVLAESTANVEPALQQESTFPTDQVALDVANAVVDTTNAEEDRVEYVEHEDAVVPSQGSEQPTRCRSDSPSEAVHSEPVVDMEPALLPEVEACELVEDSDYTAQCDEDRVDVEAPSMGDDTEATEKPVEEEAAVTPRAEPEAVTEVEAVAAAGEDYADEQYADDGFGDDGQAEQTPREEPGSIMDSLSEPTPTPTAVDVEVETEEAVEGGVKEEEGASTVDAAGGEPDVALTEAERHPEAAVLPKKGPGEAADDSVDVSGGDSSKPDSNPQVKCVENEECLDEQPVASELTSTLEDEPVDELEQQGPVDNDSIADTPSSTGPPRDSAARDQLPDVESKEQPATTEPTSSPAVDTEPAQRDGVEPSNAVSTEAEPHELLEEDPINMTPASPEVKDHHTEPASAKVIENDAVTAPEDPPSSVSTVVGDALHEELDEAEHGDQSKLVEELLVQPSGPSPDPPALEEAAAQGGESQVPDTDIPTTEQPLVDTTVDTPALEALMAESEEQLDLSEHLESTQDALPVNGSIESASNVECSSVSHDRVAEADGAELLTADAVGDPTGTGSEEPMAGAADPVQVATVNGLNDQRVCIKDEGDSVSTEAARDPHVPLEESTPSVVDLNAAGEPSSAVSEVVEPVTADTASSDAPNEAERLGSDEGEPTIPVEDNSPDEWAQNGTGPQAAEEAFSAVESSSGGNTEAGNAATTQGDVAPVELPCQAVETGNKDVESAEGDALTDAVVTSPAADTSTLGGADSDGHPPIDGLLEPAKVDTVSVPVQSEEVSSPTDEDAYAEDETTFEKETEPQVATVSTPLPPALSKGNSELALEDAYNDEASEFDQEDVASTPSSQEKEDAEVMTDASGILKPSTLDAETVASPAPESTDVEYDEFETEEDAPLPIQPASNSPKAHAEEPDEYADDAEYDGFDDDEAPPASQQATDSPAASVPSSNEVTPREETEPKATIMTVVTAPEEVEEDYAGDDDYTAEEEDFEPEENKPVVPSSPPAEEENEYENEYDEFDE